MKPITHLSSLFKRLGWTPRDVALASVGPDERAAQELTLSLEVRRAERRYAMFLIRQRCQQSWGSWTLEDISQECAPWEGT